MSLYRTGFFIRRSVVLFFIFIGILVSFGIIGSITQKLTQNLSKISPEQASLGFGQINPPTIQSVPEAATFKPTNVQVDTLTGFLPDFTLSFKNQPNDQSSLINAYQIDVPPLNAASKILGNDLKDQLGFIGNPQITQDVVYTWVDGKRTLMYSAETKTFNLTSSNITSQDITSDQQSSPDSASSFFQNILTTVKYNIQDPLSNFQNIYVNYNGSSWIPSPNNKPTNFIMSYYSRYSRSRGSSSLSNSLLDLNGIVDPRIVKEFYPYYYFSPMYMVVKNTGNIKPSDIVEMQFNKYNYSVQRPQTYNVKNVNDAYLDIQSNKAALVVFKSQDGSAIDPKSISSIKNLNVKNVELGYYVNGTKQSYVLPIYVFTCQFVISVNGTTQTKGDAIYYTYAFTN